MVRQLIQMLVTGAVRVHNKKLGLGRVLVVQREKEEPLSLEAYCESYNETLQWIDD